MLTNAITSLVTRAHAQLDSATVEEIACAAGIPLLAILLGLQIKRFIGSRKKESIAVAVLDLAVPLVTPLLAVFFALIAVAGFRMLEVDSAVLLFMLKITAAWFAIKLVILMSSQRTAGWFVALVIVPMTLLQLFDVWDLTMDALSSVTFTIGKVKLSVFLIFKGIVAILALQWIASMTVTLVDRRLNRIHDLRPSNRALIMKIFQIVLYCIVFLFGMQLLGISLTALGVFGGAVGVGLGFGLQKIASNFVSGIILLFEKSIEIGDMIELADGTTGFVRQTYARYTRLEMMNGREIFIPNEEFISQRVISWTHTNTKAQIEIIITVDYQSDLPKVRQLMLDAANGYKGRLAESEASCFLNAFGESGVEFKLQFWIRDVLKGRAQPKSDVMFAIWDAFKRHNIVIPTTATAAPSPAPTPTVAP